MAKKRKRSKAPARVEIWQDMPSKRRPTPERLRHGSWRIVDTKGGSYAMDMAAHPLDAMLERGTITKDQHLAGWQAAEIFGEHTPTPQGRSCLDFSPVGHEGDNDTPPASTALYHELWGALGHFEAAVIRDVILRGNWPNRAQHERLLKALDTCEQFFNAPRRKGR